MRAVCAREGAAYCAGSAKVAGREKSNAVSGSSPRLYPETARSRRAYAGAARRGVQERTGREAAAAWSRLDVRGHLTALDLGPRGGRAPGVRRPGEVETATHARRSPLRSRWFCCRSPGFAAATWSARRPFRRRKACPRAVVLRGGRAARDRHGGEGSVVSSPRWRSSRAPRRGGRWGVHVIVMGPGRCPRSLVDPHAPRRVLRARAATRPVARGPSARAETFAAALSAWDVAYRARAGREATPDLSRHARRRPRGLGLRRGGPLREEAHEAVFQGGKMKASQTARASGRSPRAPG